MPKARTAWEHVTQRTPKLRPKRVEFSVFSHGDKLMLEVDARSPQGITEDCTFSSKDSTWALHCPDENIVEWRFTRQGRALSFRVEFTIGWMSAYEWRCALKYLALYFNREMLVAMSKTRHRRLITKKQKEIDNASRLLVNVEGVVVA